MRRFLYLAALAVSLGLSSDLFAQGTGAGGGLGGGTGTSGGLGGGMGGGTSLGGGSGFGGGTTGGTSIAGTTLGGASFSGGSTTGGTGLLGSTTTVPGRTGPGGRAVGGGAVQISTTNFLQSSFANPLYPGRPGSTNIAPAAGGFGQPSFGNVTTGTTTPGGAAGRGGMLGGTATVNSSYGPVGSVVSPISYAAVIRFPVQPIQATQIQTELQGLISRTSAIQQPDNVRIEVTGDTVILHGRVANDDERRLVEGMVRLEPGVHEVVNQLAVK